MSTDIHKNITFKINKYNRSKTGIFMYFELILGIFSNNTSNGQLF